MVIEVNSFADTRRRPHASERSWGRLVLFSLAVIAIAIAVGVVVGLLA
jgi:hypothetical protein